MVFWGLLRKKSLEEIFNKEWPGPEMLWIHGAHGGHGIILGLPVGKIFWRMKHETQGQVSHCINALHKSPLE